MSTEDALAAPIKDTTNEHLHWGAGDLEGLHTAQAHRVAASAAIPAPAELPPVKDTTNEHLHWGAGDLDGLRAAHAHRLAADDVAPEA